MASLFSGNNRFLSDLVRFTFFGGVGGVGVETRGEKCGTSVRVVSLLVGFWV